MYQYSFALFAFLMLQFATGCSNNEVMQEQEEESGADVSFTVIQPEEGSGFGNLSSPIKRIEIYRDQASLNTAISQFPNSLTDITIDFSSKQVVLLTMGIQSSLGYSIAVEYVDEFEDYARLNVLLEVPGGREAGCPPLLGALSHPFQLLAIDTRKGLVIQERYQVEDCGN